MFISKASDDKNNLIKVQKLLIEILFLSGSFFMMFLNLGNRCFRTIFVSFLSLFIRRYAYRKLNFVACGKDVLDSMEVISKH